MNQRNDFDVQLSLLFSLMALTQCNGIYSLPYEMSGGIVRGADQMPSLFRVFGHSKTYNGHPLIQMANHC